MARTRSWLFSCLLFSFSWVATAQVAPSKAGGSDASGYEQQCRDLVSFLQFIINTVGDEATSARDKEVIIIESYQKIFRDSEVQIEDDLLADRMVATNKNIQAYLKDVDFFFKHVKFSFEVLKIEALKRENGETYFKVELNRSLSGVSLEGAAVSNTSKRFIEINLDVDKGDLKIASIYTTRISREKALMEWWNTLSFEWSTLLQKAARMDVGGNPSLEQLVAIASIDSLSLSGNRLLLDISPVEMLLGLKHIDISNTRISDLGPLRALPELQYLNVSHTFVDNIEYLRYSNELRELNISNSVVYDLEVLSELTQLRTLRVQSIPAVEFESIGSLPFLEKLDASSTALSGVGFLSSVPSLRSLKISGTNVTTLDGVQGLSNLQELIADETSIMDISQLSGLQSLETLSVNDTPISSLEPVSGLTSLKTIYCDNSSVSESHADEFMSRKKNTLIVMNSRQLDLWWGGLTADWQRALLSVMSLEKGQRPGKEQMVDLVNRDSLSLSGKGISNLSPLERFKKLTYLDISKNPVSELIGLAGLQQVKVLRINDMPLENLVPLKSMMRLERLEAVNTKVYELGALMSLPHLEYVNVDNSFVTRGEVVSFLEQQPQSTVIFRSAALLDWWQSLPVEWQAVFRTNHTLSANPGSADLHALTARNSINAANGNVKSVQPLYIFLTLEELDMSGTGISNLSEFATLDRLQKLSLSKNPISFLQPLQGLVALQELDVSNTAITDLREISTLTQLKALNCSGTQLKQLKGVERFVGLNELDVSNTRVGKLDNVFELRELVLFTCFNTKLTSREMDNFKRLRPECKVVYY